MLSQVKQKQNSGNYKLDSPNKKLMLVFVMRKSGQLKESKFVQKDDQQTQLINGPELGLTAGEK